MIRYPFPLGTLPTIMAKPKPSLARPEETLEALLDKVSNAREELTTIERTLERLRVDIAKALKRSAPPRKIR